MLPLFIELTGRKVAVFGAGGVGQRKANFFAREADVTAIGLKFSTGFDPRVRLVKGEIREEMERWVDWADLVVAATDDAELNDAIARAAQEKGKLCNRADGVSTFLIPSLVEKDGYCVAISTLGRSPGMSKFLRLKLERELGPRFDLMVRLQEELRELARSRIPDQVDRERFLWTVLEDDAVWSLLESDYPKAREAALAILEAA